MPFYVSCWLGGHFTNFEIVKRNAKKYCRSLAMEADSAVAAMLKKEASAICRQMARMHRGFEALLEVDDLPDALFAVDVNYEDIAIMQANCLHIPIIAVIDTKSDPTHITRMIFVNNDSTKSRNLFWKRLWRRFKLDRQPKMRSKWIVKAQENSFKRRNGEG